MKKSVKEFILKEHASVPNCWKKPIEERYPELFKKELKVWKWYKDETSTLMVFIQKIYGDKIIGYGVGGSGLWSSPNSMFYGSNMKEAYSELRPATDTEVKEMLIKEAEKRGFKEGVKVNAENIKFYQGCFNSMRLKDSKFTLEGDYLFVKSDNDYTICIFKDGNWAEIIEEENPSVMDTFQCHWKATDGIKKEVELLQRQLDELKDKL